MLSCMSVLKIDINMEKRCKIRNYLNFDFPIGRQAGNDKYATGAKLREREDITIATLQAKWRNFCMRWADTNGTSLNCVRWNGKSLEKSKQMRSVTECISVEKMTNMNKGWVS